MGTPGLLSSAALARASPGGNLVSDVFSVCGVLLMKLISRPCQWLGFLCDDGRAGSPEECFDLGDEISRKPIKDRQGTVLSRR